jgi:hypothetical protein
VRRLVAAFVRARRRSGRLDHVASATARYDQADGGRLAALAAALTATSTRQPVHRGR